MQRASTIVGCVLALIARPDCSLDGAMQTALPEPISRAAHSFFLQPAPQLAEDLLQSFFSPGPVDFVPKACAIIFPPQLPAGAAPLVNDFLSPAVYSVHSRQTPTCGFQGSYRFSFTNF